MTESKKPRFPEEALNAAHAALLKELQDASTAALAAGKSPARHSNDLANRVAATRAALAAKR